MNEKIKRSYFSAANGFCGFRSYFAESFPCAKNERIYILKGGPGTGKSSFMRKIANEFEDKNCNIDLIHCSSDPNSLDGVIIEQDGVQISILDGTAPHEFDTRIPGAVDEIINLGDSWNKEGLKRKRKDIEKLINEKSKSYKSAYEYLKLAGEFNTRIMELSASLINLDEKFMDGILSQNSYINSSRNKETILISAFGKDGHVKLDTSPYKAKNCYSIRGIFESEYIFMRRLTERAHNLGLVKILFPSPFGGELIEGVRLSDTLLLTNSQGGTVIDTSKYFNAEELMKNRARLEFFEMTKSKLLALSRAEFLSASDAHFELEKIYTAEMDFKKNDELLSKVKAEISKIFKNK